MKKISITIAVVLASVFIVSASAIIANYPLQQQTSNQLSNLYNADLTYVYVGRTNSTGGGHDHFGFGIPTYPSNYYPATIVLNLTYLGNPNNEPWDQKSEGYTVNFTADTGATASYSGWLGTNYNLSSLSPVNPFPGSPSGPRTIVFHFNAMINEPFLLQISDGGSFGSRNGTLGLWSNGTPNTITVTVQRAGWVIVNGTSPTTITNPARDVVIQQVQLQKSGEGFSFGVKPQKIPFTSP